MAIRFKDVNAVAGRMNAVLADAVAAALGTHQVAPGRTGVIARQLAPVTGSFIGQFAASVGRTGVIAAQLQNITFVGGGQNAQPGAQTLESDWIARSTGDGVMWAHDFRSDAEVNQFRNTNGYGGGNDPLANGSGATLLRRITTDGMASGACVEALVGPGTAGQGSYWWRPFSPMATPGNGRAVDDPGANGEISAKTWNPTDGGSQLSNWTQGWYGHPTYANAQPSNFDGNEFYLQVVAKMDPRRITGGNAANSVGKFIWLTTAEGRQSLSAGEHVIWSYGTGGNDGTKNYFRVYALGVNGIGSFDPLDQEEATGRIQPGSESAVDWSWSGGWDTVLIRLRPGLISTTSGANSTLLEVWAAKEGETSYTKIWSQEYGLSGYEARNGLQALILGGYNNSASFPQQFFHRFAQVIFSRNFIPCPQAYPSTLPAWASAQTDKTWTQPLTSFTTLRSVQPSPAPTGNNSPTGLINSWSSGVAGIYNGRRGYFMFGGGHQDYSGNEVYFLDAFDRRWYRIKDNTTNLSGGTATAYADGTPRVPHTYRHVVWTPGYLWLMHQAGPYPSGDSYYGVWRLNLSTLTWQQIATDMPGTKASTAEVGSHYSARRGLIYTINQAGEVWATNVATGAITKVNSNFVPGSSLNNASTFCDSLGALFFRGSGGQVSVLNVDNASAGWTQVTVTGTFGVSNYPGFVWHEASKKLIAWGHSSSRQNLFTLSPPTAAPTSFAQLLGTWTAATVTPDASNAVTPSNPDATGTFKRFELIESMGNSGRDWLVLFNSIDDSPYFYKLPSAGV